MRALIFPLLMAFLWGNVFIAAGAILQRRGPVIVYTKFLPFLMLPVLSVIRLFIPAELPYTKVIRSETVFPQIVLFLRETLRISNSFTVTVYLILLFVWVSGIITSVCKMVFRYIRFQRHMLNKQRPADSGTAALMSEFAERYFTERHFAERHKTKLNIKVVRTSYVNSPMLTGFIKPVIYLPDINFTEEELKYILWHEITHYSHKDLWVKLLIT